MSQSQQARNKRAGAKFETDLVTWLRNQGLDAERLRLSGTLDEGDIYVTDGEDRWLIEAKAEKSYDLSGYMGEVMRERENYAARRAQMPDDIIPVVIVKRRNRPIEDAFVIMSLGEFFSL